MPLHTPLRLGTAGSRLDSARPDQLRAYDRLRRPYAQLEIVVPCRNEAARLPATLERAVDYLAQQPWSSSLVVIDNGSVDRTSAVVEELDSPAVPVRRLGCSTPGKGAAVRRGISTSGARWVGFMDADLATPIETLDRVVPLLDDGAAAVCASRYAEGAQLAAEQPSFRKLGGLAFRALAGRVVPSVADTQCGFKFFDGDLVRSLVPELTVDGFAFDLELLAAVAARGHDIVEVPVVWSDVAGSTFSARADGVRSMRDAAGMALRTVTR